MRQRIAVPNQWREQKVKFRRNKNRFDPDQCYSKFLGAFTRFETPKMLCLFFFSFLSLIISLLCILFITVYICELTNEVNNSTKNINKKNYQHNHTNQKIFVVYYFEMHRTFLCIIQQEDSAVQLNCYITLFSNNQVLEKRNFFN